MNQGKKITIFLAAGLPKGVREVRIDQWSGKAICGPRNALNEIITLPEIESGACVYFLIGSSDEGGLLNVYVGEADGFKERIRDHDYKKDWWQDVVVFVSQDGSLTKTGIQYLESVCIERLKKIGKCNLKNANNPGVPTIPKEDVSGLEVFYENLATIMPLLGYDIFVQSEFTSGKTPVTPLVFICKKGSNIIATGHLLEDGKMKVLKSSTASLEETPSFQTHPYKKLKDELVAMQRLSVQGTTLVFTDDYVFDSSSAACGVILGRSASGPLEWKSKDGITLKEVLNSRLKN
ncbi:MAG: GIY-YIG nuclease family protein [Candidatus Sungbacteria bacterium]|nr:GIY-YIG nuclease family protein [Candidatus Sungbacteria bacterium]